MATDCSKNHAPLWSVVTVILVAIVLGSAFGYGQNEGMKSKNDTQDLRIQNVEGDINEIKTDIKDFRTEQRTFNEKILEELRGLSYQHNNGN